MKQSLTHLVALHNENNWVATCDFQERGILTNLDTDEHVQPTFKVSNSKWVWSGNTTINSHQFFFATPEFGKITSSF